MKFKKLLSILFTVGMLVACGQTSGGGGGSSTPTDKEDGTHTIVVNNLDEMTADWMLGDAPRTISLTLKEGETDKAPLIELASGNLSFEVTNKNVISTSGLVFSAIGEGSTKVAIKYYGTTKVLDFTILHRPSNKELYNTTHEGNAEDPFDNEDALKVAKALEEAGNISSNTDQYYFKGTVASFYHAPGTRTDKVCSWFLTPAVEGGEQFEIYKCTITDEGASANRQWTDDDIWVGAITTVKGNFAVYNGQYETGGATLIKVEGTKPAPRQVVEKTFAEVLAANDGLADGADTYDYFKFEGFVSGKDGKNYFLTATKGEELVSATSDEAHGSKSYYSNAFEIFNFGGTALLKDAKVEVTSVVKNYHGQAENLYSLTDEEVVVLEEGVEWPAAELEELTVAQALAKVEELEEGATSASAFKITGYIVAITSAFSSQYKNISFTIGDATDATALLTVFRAAATAELAEKLLPTAKISLTGKLQKYVKDGAVTPELINGENVTILEEASGETPEPEEVTVAQAIEIIDGLEAGAKTSVNYAVTGFITEVTTAFNSQYGNLSFNMGDTVDATVVLGVYRGTATAELAAKLVAGAKVKVTGLLDNNSHGKQVAQGGVVELLEEAPAQELTGIALNKETAEVTVGGTIELSVSPVPERAELGNEVVWNSNNEEVATVEGGVVTGVAAGEATITATVGEFSASCVVTVKEATGEELTPLTIANGENCSACTVNGKDATKIGTSKLGGSFSVTVPSGATKLVIYVVAWKGVSNLELNLTCDNEDAVLGTSSIALTADDGASNNTPFTLVGEESTFMFEIELSNVTQDTVITFTTSQAKRCIVWGAAYK